MADAPKIFGTDSLRQAYPKLNSAIDNSNEALSNANTARADAINAVSTANEANAKSDDTQQQLNNIVINNGESDAEVLQARGSYPVLNERLNKNDRRVENISINIKDFGAEGNELVDDTNAIQNAYNSLNSGDTLLIPHGSYYFTNLLFDKDDIFIECKGILYQKTDATGVAIIVGKSTPSYGVQGLLKVRKQSRNWLQDNTGVKILNMNEGIFTVDIRDFTNNLEIEGNNNGCSYNEITIKKLYNGKKNLKFTANGTGWANENKFYSGRFHWSSGITDNDRHHIYIPTNVINNNVFFSPSLESVGGGTLIYCNGQYNHFYSPRLEADPSTTKVNFDTQSIYNQIVYPYAHTDISTNISYVDLGSRNHVLGRDELLLNHSRVRASAFVGVGNPKQNPAWGNEATFEGQSTSSSADKIFKGKNVSGTETFFVDGNGNVKGNTFQFNSGIGVLQTGEFDGSFKVSDSYITKSFKVSAVKTTAGAPTSNTPQIGTQLLNTNESRLYIHLGGGVWKYINLT